MSCCTWVGRLSFAVSSLTAPQEIFDRMLQHVSVISVCGDGVLARGPLEREVVHLGYR